MAGADQEPILSNRFGGFRLSWTILFDIDQIVLALFAITLGTAMTWAFAFRFPLAMVRTGAKISTELSTLRQPADGIGGVGDLTLCCVTIIRKVD
jgi:hypothetical protein